MPRKWFCRGTGQAVDSPREPFAGGSSGQLRPERKHQTKERTDSVMGDRANIVVRQEKDTNLGDVWNKPKAKGISFEEFIKAEVKA